MKIVDIEIAIHSVPLPKPVVTPIHHITTIDDVLVTIKTDEGIEGIGYLWTFGIGRARVLAAMVEDLKPLLVGQDPIEHGELSRRLWNDTNFLGRAGIAIFAQSVIDTALWDITAKSFGVPLYRLLGGAAKPLPVYAGGLFLSDTIDAIVDEARGYVGRGFTAMKMRVGAKDWRQDIARVEAIRATIGDDAKLMLDVVQGWTTDQAIKMGRELERFNIFWLEDPVMFDDHAGLAKVAAALDMPVAAGENDYGRQGFRRLIEGRCVDIAMIDLQRSGGVTEWLKIASLAEAFGMTVVPHVFYEISVHMLASINNGGWLEYVPWWDVLFQHPLPVINGTVTPSNKPGLGIDFNHETLDRYRVS